MKTNTEFEIRLRTALARTVGGLLFIMAAANGLAQTYTIVHDFTDSRGQYFEAPVVCSGTTLYGMTINRVFKVNTDGTGFVELYDMQYNDMVPNGGGLAVDGSTVYVTRAEASSSNNGSVFKMNTDGTGYALLKRFTGGTDGAQPWSPPVLSGATLYGTTSSGGVTNKDFPFGAGTIFKIQTDGSGYTILKAFTGGGDGAIPDSGALLLSGTTFYGTTHAGGLTNAANISGAGMVFKLNTDGSGYSVLKSLNPDTDGACPAYAPLVLADGTLYGTTWEGNLFKVQPDGSGFAVLYRSVNDDGANAWGPMALSGTTLYGAGNNKIFKINLDGSGFTILKRSKDDWPAGVMLSGTNLYGTTYVGGYMRHSVLYCLSLPIPVMLSAPRTQTAELGSTIRLEVGAAPAPLAYWWFHDGTNLTSSPTTNAWLELTNLQTRDNGAYTVLITNGFGAATSTPAILSVVPSVPRRIVPAMNLTCSAGTALHLTCANTPCATAFGQDLDVLTPASGQQFYADLTDPLPPARYYRAWQTGTPGVLPSLTALGMVPAITVTGNLGDSLRVDCINRYGPTDAWVTLDTVTLTKTSQLYFDVSAPGQPERLYRLVPVP
jgi:uncharacterized repeat protein (TIGR03803 family)